MAAYKDEARGTWYVSFHYNDWTGKNKRKLKRGFRTRKEALEYEQKFLLQQATNLDMRFEDFYKLYEEDLKPKLKLNTWRTKDVIFQKKLIPYFKDKKMNEISPADIIKWQNEMIKKRQADGKPYKPTYLKTMQSELSAIFNHAVRFYNLRENPVKKAGTIGKGKADEMDFWTKEEYLKFIECVKDKPISYYAFQMIDLLNILVDKCNIILGAAGIHIVGNKTSCVVSDRALPIHKTDCSFHCQNPPLSLCM